MVEIDGLNYRIMLDSEVVSAGDILLTDFELRKIQSDTIDALLIGVPAGVARKWSAVDNLFTKVSK